MKRPFFALLFVVAVSFAAVAVAGPRLNPNVRVVFKDCSAWGSAVQVVPDGEYLFKVTDQDTFVCWDRESCIGDGGVEGGSDGGVHFPAGFAMRQSFLRTDGGTPLSCRSAGDAGDLDLMQISPGT